MNYDSVLGVTIVFTMIKCTFYVTQFTIVLKRVSFVHKPQNIVVFRSSLTGCIFRSRQVFHAQFFLEGYTG